MDVVDDMVPAACHLTGTGAARVLRAALDPLGGRLISSTPCHVHYRPGHDVAVRFDATVSWRGGPPVPETLLAGATVAGTPPGTLPIEGLTTEGETVHVGVWRWPFDPKLPGLAEATVPSSAARLLGDVVTGPVRLEVLAYRPTQRAVIRVDDADGRTVYVKALRRRDVAGLVARHVALAAAGLPVPDVVHADEARGLVVLAEIAGPTARQRYLADGPWPDVDDYLGVIEAIGRGDLSTLPERPGRLVDALGHARLLERVLPDQQVRLTRITEVVAAASATPRRAACVHGDLYESQLITAPDSARLVGVIDLDDAGPGDPLDDRATILAHLWTRAIDPPRRVDLLRHVDQLRLAFAGDDGRAELDVVTAAVLVGLATGPFRQQSRGWRRQSRRILARAELLATAGGRVPPTR